MADSPSVLVTLRLSARDHALLEQLVEKERRELEDLGVEASLSSVMRKLIRAAAKASATGVDAAPARPAAAVATTSAPAAPSVSQDQVARAPTEEDGRARGLGAELARKLGVERAQVSRLKAGKEPFPAAKLTGLLELLT